MGYLFKFAFKKDLEYAHGNGGRQEYRTFKETENSRVLLPCFTIKIERHD